MKKQFIFGVILFGLAKLAFAADSYRVQSPNQQITVSFSIENGRAYYRVIHKGVEIIKPSALGFRFNRQPALRDNLKILDTQIREVNNRWGRIWGPSKTVSNHFRELKLALHETTTNTPKINASKINARKFNVVFRVFNDGLGFRYEFPEQEHLIDFEILSEETQFSFNRVKTAWWIPADYDSYEALYRETSLTEAKAVNTPITMETETGVFISLHEAALTNYAGMTLVQSQSNAGVFSSDLVPWPDGIKVKGRAPFKTPWRTLQIADTAGALIESDLIENLNEPNVIADTSWIQPMKYIGIWWGMHMRKYTWKAGPKHGATTDNTKKYIDFAQQHGLQGVLVEGWNQGWETWHTGQNVQDFTQAYSDFDLQALVRYGRENGVSLIGHHETGGNIPLYEKQMEKAFQLYNKVGVTALKTGYAGKMYPEGVYHHGQQMVNHYRRVVELAAKYHIMVNAHEPIKPTGIRRTYPNMMTREGVRGMEYNGWSEGNSPEHTLMLPFTRMLAGPLDYTPGIFNIKFDPQGQYRVNTTLAKQLALFVVLYSPMQMAADMIENYNNQPAFNFIKHVPVSWDETRVLHGEIGNFIAIARRKGLAWFIGTMTDENSRTLDIPLDFLLPEKSYLAHIYTDAIDTEFESNPTAIEIGTYHVSHRDVLPAAMASGGGQAVHIVPVDSSRVKNYPALSVFTQSTTVKAQVFKHGRRFGEIRKVSHLAVDKKLTLHTSYDKNYTGGSGSALVDGVKGSSDYKTLWQGYRKQDLIAEIDLGTHIPIKEIEIGFLQSILHSILLPSQVEFSVSDNGVDYKIVASEEYLTRQGDPDFQHKSFKASFEPRQTRYVRVYAKNARVLPVWHIRPGQEAFIFADEIQVH